MKKVLYIAMGFLLGIVFMTAGVTFADQVKSLVGKKVTGEYTIIVDGKKLSDKGAVIDNKANVPARALSEALGADVSVSGKTITISSENSTSQPSESTNQITVKYQNMSKSSLESSSKNLKQNILEPTLRAIDEIEDSIQKVKDEDKEYREYLERQKQIYRVSIQQSKESGAYDMAAEWEGRLKEVEDLLADKKPSNQDSILKKEKELEELKQVVSNTESEIKLIDEALLTAK